MSEKAEHLRRPWRGRSFHTHAFITPFRSSSIIDFPGSGVGSRVGSASHSRERAPPQRWPCCVSRKEKTEMARDLENVSRLTAAGAAT